MEEREEHDLQLKTAEEAMGGTYIDVEKLRLPAALMLKAPPSDVRVRVRVDHEDGEEVVVDVELRLDSETAIGATLRRPKEDFSLVSGVDDRPRHGGDVLLWMLADCCNAILSELRKEN